MNKDVKKRIEELVTSGSLVQRPGGLDTVGFARFTDSSIGWCTMFPEDQHHVHSLRYSKARLEGGGRDVGFYDGLELIAYLAPYQEWHLREEGDFLLEHANWGRYLDDLGNRPRLQQFFETTLDSIGG
jgi:hypothetical protein